MQHKHHAFAMAASQHVCCHVEPPAAQVELPCSRQPTNATDTMAQMVLPGQSCNSAQALSCSAKGKQSPGPRAAPVRIQLKQPLGLEPAAERMAMSGDLGSQVCLICLCLCTWLGPHSS